MLNDHKRESSLDIQIHERYHFVRFHTFPALIFIHMKIQMGTSYCTPVPDSPASGVTLGMALSVDWSATFRLKYLNYYWMDGCEILL